MSNLLRINIIDARHAAWVDLTEDERAKEVANAVEFLLKCNGAMTTKAIRDNNGNTVATVTLGAGYRDLMFPTVSKANKLKIPKEAVYKPLDVLGCVGMREDEKVDRKPRVAKYPISSAYTETDVDGFDKYVSELRSYARLELSDNYCFTIRSGNHSGYTAAYRITNPNSKPTYWIDLSLLK